MTDSPAPPPDDSAQRNSRSYLLAVEDTQFLLRDELRDLRFALEYAKPEFLLRDWGVRSTIIVFGSARMPSPEQAVALRAAATDDGERKRIDEHVAYYQAAREFGRIASQRGGAFSPQRRWRDNVIATGGGPGIMEAANRGAFDVGAPNIGFNIGLPHEQVPNPYTTPELTFQFHYFGMRKMHMAMRANALVVFPGGFGTFDELFEILTLVQTGKTAAIPIVLFGESYWRKMINFDALVEEGVIARDDLAHFEFSDSAEDTWQKLVRKGLTAHSPPESVQPGGTR